MNNIKDIQRTDKVSSFFDNQTVKTSPFGENRSGERVYRRVERIVAAIHLITNHIDSHEPARSAVRTSCISLLNDTLSLRDEMRSRDSEKVRAIEATIRYLMSLVRTLSVSGFVSLQNADVVIEALDDIGVFLRAAQRSPLSESIKLSKESLLDVRDTAVKYTSDSGSLSDISEESVTDTSERFINQKDTARTEMILSVLRSGGELSIRDVAAQLPEYSEKMIQRELADLVASGVIQKVGEKRWSRYHMRSLSD